MAGCGSAEALEIAHCASIASACRTFIDRAVIRYCFGEGVEPLAYFGLPGMDDEDAQQLRENAGFIADRGGRVDLANIADRLDVPLADESAGEDEVLQPARPATAPGDEDSTQRRGDAKRTENAARLSRLQQLVEEALRTANMNDLHDRLGRFSLAPEGSGGGGSASRTTTKALDARDVGSFFEEASKGQRSGEAVEFGKVSGEMATRLRDEAGLDVKPGTPHELSAEYAAHLAKSQRRPESGQRAITREDVERLPEVLAHPDRIVPGKSTPRHHESAVFTKQFADGKLIATEALRREKPGTRHEFLEVISMIATTGGAK